MKRGLNETDRIECRFCRWALVVLPLLALAVVAADWMVGR